MLRRSGSILPIHSDEMLRHSIKDFLNKIISQSSSTFQTFKNTMLDIFTLETKKYQQDMLFEIGTKVSLNTKVYTQEEITSPGFFVKGNEIMRIMMKWIEELLDFFK